MRWKVLMPLLAVFFLDGCAANLAEIRDFAGEAAKFTEFKDLTVRYRDTYEREKPFLAGESDSLGRAGDIKRREDCEDLLKIHSTLTSYMRTLARLAGEETFDISGEVSSLKSSIEEHPDLQIEKRHVDACFDIGKIVAKWMTASIQNQAVREMIKEGDPHLQTLLDGMADIVRIYRKVHESEKAQVLGFLEFETAEPGRSESGKQKPGKSDGPGTPSGQNVQCGPDRETGGCKTLLTALARDRAREKTLEYLAVERKYSQALKGIEKIAEGHGKLYENVDRLSTGEIRDLAKKFTEEIRALKKNLDVIQS